MNLKWKTFDPSEEVTWRDVRASISKTDPIVGKIIDDIDPDDSFKLIRIRYPYGAIIYESGQFYVPSDKGEILPIHHADVPDFVRKALSYRPVPLGYVVHNSFEVFKQAGNHIFPISHRRHGFDLGIWEAFMPTSPFTVTSGARSIFMLPKITDLTNHKKLKKYGVKGPAPFNSFDQWEIFREMANHADFPEDWYCEIVFFSEKWFKHITTGSRWVKFYNFLLLKSIKHTEPEHIKTTYDNVWENFSLTRSAKRLKSNTHIVETLKHLIFIASGVLPGFKVAIESNPAPISGIRDIYLNDYGLKTYVPTMMYADYFKKESDEFVYYSMQIPTSPNTILKNKSSSTTRADIVGVLDVVDDFIFELTKSHLGPASESIYNLFSEIQFDFFHSEADEQEGLYPSSELSKEDANLLKMPKTEDEREFCSKATFVRGCVRISKK